VDSAKLDRTGPIKHDFHNMRQKLVGKVVQNG
jgi:hypothetical protein